MEFQVLGILIRGTGEANKPKVFERLTLDHFSDPKLQKIFAAVAATWARSGKVSLAAVIAETRKVIENPDAYQNQIREILHSAPADGMLDEYLDILEEWKSRRVALRAIHAAAHGLLNYEDGVEETLARLEADLSAGRIDGNHTEDDPRNKPAILDRVIGSILDPKPTDLVKTGFVDLDKVTGGMKGGELIIVAGRPGSGKSALAGSIADNVASAGIPFLYFSLEMNARKIWIRQLAWRARIDASKLARGEPLSEDEKDRLLEARKSLEMERLYIDCRPNQSLTQIRTRIRYGIEALRIGVVAIDQATWIWTDPKLDERARLSFVSRSAKMLAEEFDIPILLMHQLNREAENPMRNFKPEMRHLKGSGSFEEDADMVWLCYRPENYGVPFLDDNGIEEPSEGLGEIIVEKNRDGSPRSIRMAFLGRFVRWEDLAVGVELNRGLAPLHGVEW